MIQSHPSIDFSIPAMCEWEKLPEGVRAEVVNRKLYILPPPSLYHADVITDIFFELINYVRREGLGKVYCSDVGVFLFDGTNVVIPDIIFVSNANFHLFEEKGVFGAADLHIEVLSPGNRKHDLVRKKHLYEKGGVLEYWIVDPQTKNAQGYLLEDGKYGDPLTMDSEIYIRILGKHIPF
jgi:Uma2 family endonuclease